MLGRDRAQQRHDPEPGDADQEHASLAEQVSERSSDEDQRAERQQVSVRDPLLAGEPATEVGTDRRQRHVHSGRVQPRHERTHDRRDQSQALAPSRHPPHVTVRR